MKALGLALASVLAASTASADVLTLQQYMDQVMVQHQGIRSSQEISSGAQLRSEEGELLTSPFLFANASYRDDKKPTLAPSFQGTRTKSEAYSLGVKQLFSFGLNSAISYNLDHVIVEGASLIPVPKVYTAYPMLELSQSLWRNGFGSETRANLDLIEAGALATSYGESYRLRLQRAEAETNYWFLVLARDTVSVQEDVYDRAMKILAWAKKRAGLNLGDRSDVLQAQAALQVRELELQAARNEEVAASHRFNTSRNLEGSAVPYELQKLNTDALIYIKAPQRAKMRDDVKAAEQAQRVAIANANLALDRDSPNLDIYGTVALNSTRDPSLSEATSTSFKSDFPTYTVGLRFLTSLDFWRVSDARKGYIRERAGAERNFTRKLYEQEREWDDLVRRLAENQKKLKLAAQIERAQEEKLVYEKQRLNRGRTTTYQVLLFEQDYAQAQISRIRAQGEVLRVISQMKLFGGDV